MKHSLKDLETYINSNTVVVGDFNTTLSSIDRHPNIKINKEIRDLNHTIDQIDLANVNRIFHATTAQCIFFSAAHGAFSKINRILGHKASLSKYKKIQISHAFCLITMH
jgi:hypothetical protein